MNFLCAETIILDALKKEMKKCVFSRRMASDPFQAAQAHHKIWFCDVKLLDMKTGKTGKLVTAILRRRVGCGALQADANA